MASERSKELYRALLEKNIPEELSEEIAYTYLNTDYTATRMLGYLYRGSELSVEQVVDEMIAILEDRERFRKKHETEAAQAAITKMYNSLTGQK